MLTPEKNDASRCVAFAARAVNRQFYTGCVDNEITSEVRVDAGSDSLIDFERREHHTLR